MKIDLPPNGAVDALQGVAVAARTAERAGVDGLTYPDRAADAILHVTLAAPATRRVDLITSVVVAFARSPMTLASQAWSLQQLSHGRLVLGLGSQVRAHVERRFAMPWGSPVPRMRDFVGALRAIWRSWQTGADLAYEGRFYRHTLMSPMFRPTGGWPAPKVMLAGLGPAMTGLAAEIADGVLIHPFGSESYIRDQVIPAVRLGLAARGKDEHGTFEISGAPLIATGHDERSLRASREILRTRLAFYGSTPSYRRVLKLHGWDDLAARLRELSTTSDPGRWAQMSALIPAEMVDEFALTGPPKDVADALVRRYGKLLDRCEVNILGPYSLGERLQFVHDIRAAVVPAGQSSGPDV